MSIAGTEPKAVSARRNGSISKNERPNGERQTPPETFARSSWAPVRAVAAEEDQHHQHYSPLIQIKALKRPEDAEFGQQGR